MPNCTPQDRRHERAGSGTSQGPEKTTGRRPPWQGSVLARVVAAGAGAGATLVALAVPAAAMGGPNPYDDAQVGLTYPVYQPMTVLGLPLTSFKLLPCAAGQDESVSATYGRAYTPISNFGKLPGFSIAEGYPDICANPGLSWQVGIWNVGIPKDMVSVKVSVYCDPAVLKNCTVANGVKSGYVLQWAQPYQFGTSPAKQTEMFIDTSLLTLPQALHIVAGIRALGTAKAADLQSLGEPRVTAKCNNNGSYREATPTSPMTTISGQKWTSGFSLIGINCDTYFTWQLNYSYSTLKATMALDAADSGPLAVEFRSGNTPIKFQAGGKTVSRLKVTGSTSVQVPVGGVGQLSIVLPNPASDAGILDVTANSLS
jgi:hypothetical protein